MIISFTNVIGAIRSLGEAGRVITNNLKMWLGFETSETLGREIVINGDFATDSDWTKLIPSGQVVEFVNNQLHINYDASEAQGTTGVRQSILTVGKTYEISIDIQSITRTLTVLAGGVSNNFDTIGVKTFTVTPTTNALLQIINPFGAGQTNNMECYINSISVKQLTQITPDKSGNNNVGELFTGKALEFDGSTTYVSANSFAGTLSNNTAFTFAIWFNSDKIATDYFRNILISSGGPQQFTNIFKIGVNPQTSATGSANVGGIYFDDSAGAYNNVVPLSGGVNYNDGEWHRLVVSRPQGSGNQTLTFYVDGSSIGTAPCNPYWNNVNLFDFGQEWDGGGTSDHFAGMMSNIQVYDYAWTTDDVTYDYANPNKLAIDNPSTSLSVTNLKAYWALSEGDGFVAYDSGTNLEEDVVINGDFATDSVWGKGAGWTITNGKARNDGTAGNNNLSQGGLLEVGKSYQITIEVSDFVSGIVEVSAGGSPRGTMTANGTYTFNQVASGTVFYIISKTFNGSVDNVSVREVTASDHGGLINGADYVDAQPRIPQLGMQNWSKGSNLVTYSEEFDNTAWTHVGTINVTANNIASPSGSITADKIEAIGTTSFISNIINGVDATQYTSSVFVKNIDSVNTSISIRHTITALSSVLNWSGSVLDSITNNTGVSTFTDEGNGWYRITSSYLSVEATQRTRYNPSSGTANKSIYLWGAQLEQSATVGNYRLTYGGATLNSTVIPNPTIPTKDIFGNAVRDRLNSFNLDGTGYAEVADDTDLDFGTGAFTMECWVVANYIDKGDTINVILSLGGNMKTQGTAGIAIKGSTSKIRGIVASEVVDSDSSFTAGQWYHVVVTRNDSGLCTLYIDSEAQGDTETTATVSNAFSKFIGKDTDIDRNYEDLISDVRLYDRALTSDEVENNYNAGLSAHTN